MKFTGMVITALCMTVSASAFAGASVSMYSANGVKLKGNYSSFNESKDRIENNKFSDKTVGEDLCGQAIPKGEALTAYIPCPADGVVNEIVDFYLGVGDRKTGARDFSCDLATCYVWNHVTEDNKNGDLSKADVLMDCYHENESYWWFDASAQFRLKVINDKQNKTGLDGENCVHGVKSQSLIGEVDGDPVMRGTFKVQSVRNGLTGTEVFGD